MGKAILLAGRILGSLLFVAFVVLMIREGLSWKSLNYDDILFLMPLITSCIGIIASFWRPIPGALLTIIGISSFYEVNYYQGDIRFVDWPFSLFFVAGLLVLVGELLLRKHPAQS